MRPPLRHAPPPPCRGGAVALLAGLLMACGAPPSASWPSQAGMSRLAVASPASSVAPASPSPTAASPSPTPTDLVPALAVSPRANALTSDWIVFVSRRGEGATRQRDFDVYFYSPDSDTVISLPGVNTPGDEEDASISSNGRWLLYLSNWPHGDRDVFLYDVALRLRNNLPRFNTREDEVKTSVNDDGTLFVSTRREGTWSVCASAMW